MEFTLVMTKEKNRFLNWKIGAKQFYGFIQIFLIGVLVGEFYSDDLNTYKKILQIERIQYFSKQNLRE